MAKFKTISLLALLWFSAPLHAEDDAYWNLGLKYFTSLSTPRVAEACGARDANYRTRFSQAFSKWQGVNASDIAKAEKLLKDDAAQKNIDLDALISEKLGVVIAQIRDASKEEVVQLCDGSIKLLE